jgi:hypothetical protein
VVFGSNLTTSQVWSRWRSARIFTWMALPSWTTCRWRKSWLLSQRLPTKPWHRGMKTRLRLINKIRKMSLLARGKTYSTNMFPSR